MWQGAFVAAPIGEDNDGENLAWGTLQRRWLPLAVLVGRIPVTIFTATAPLSTELLCLQQERWCWRVLPPFLMWRGFFDIDDNSWWRQSFFQWLAVMLVKGVSRRRQPLSAAFALSCLTKLTTVRQRCQKMVTTCTFIFRLCCC